MNIFFEKCFSRTHNNGRDLLWICLKNGQWRRIALQMVIDGSERRIASILRTQNGGDGFSETLVTTCKTTRRHNPSIQRDVNR
jgi:hypothetical protein